DVYEPTVDSLLPRRADRRPSPATAINLARLSGKPDIGCPLVVFDQLDRKAEGGFKDSGNIRIVGARSFASEFYRLLRGEPLVDGGDATGLCQGACRLIHHGRAEPLEFSSIEFDALVA